MSTRLVDPFAAGLDAGQRFPQRRTCSRYLLRWQVRILDPIQRTRVDAQTNEVSIKGCCVNGPAQFDPGAVVKLEFHWQEETAEIWARVTGVQNDGCMGFAFLGTNHEQILARWIDAEHRAS